LPVPPPKASKKIITPMRSVRGFAPGLQRSGGGRGPRSVADEAADDERHSDRHGDADERQMHEDR
jgi:hypothetical protein